MNRPPMLLTGVILLLTACTVATRSSSRERYTAIARAFEAQQDPFLPTFDAWARRSKTPDLLECVSRIERFRRLPSQGDRVGLDQGFRTFDPSRIGADERRREGVRELNPPVWDDCSEACAVGPEASPLDVKFSNTARETCESSRIDATDAYHDIVGIYLFNTASRYITHAENNDRTFVYRARVLLALEDSLNRIEPLGPKTMEVQAEFNARHQALMASAEIDFARRYWARLWSDPEIEEGMSDWYLIEDLYKRTGARTYELQLAEQEERMNVRAKQIAASEGGEILQMWPRDFRGNDLFLLREQTLDSWSKTRARVHSID